MHRSLWYRAVVALWGLWITAALVEPAGVRGCAMHGGRAVQAMPAPSAASASAGAADAHAHHGPSATSPVDAGAPESSGHECCTCLGRCCAASTVVAPAVSVAFVASVEQRTARPATVSTTRPETERPYALPFANGPPLAVRG